MLEFDCGEGVGTLLQIQVDLSSAADTKRIPGHYFVSSLIMLGLSSNELLSTTKSVTTSSETSFSPTIVLIVSAVEVKINKANATHFFHDTQTI